jgi:hypothetical protein
MIPALADMTTVPVDVQELGASPFERVDAISAILSSIGTFTRIRSAAVEEGEERRHNVAATQV